MITIFFVLFAGMTGAGSATFKSTDPEKRKNDFLRSSGGALWSALTGFSVFCMKGMIRDAAINHITKLRQILHLTPDIPVLQCSRKTTDRNHSGKDCHCIETLPARKTWKISGKLSELVPHCFVYPVPGNPWSILPTGKIFNYLPGKYQF